MEKFGDKGLKVKEKIPIGLFFKLVMVRPRPYKFIQSNSSAIFPQPIQLCQQQNRWGALNSLDLKNYFIFFISFQKTIWESEWRPGQLLFLKIYNPIYNQREERGHWLQMIFSTSSRGNRMVSVSCFRRWTHRPLAIVTENLQNLLSCLKVIKCLTFLIIRLQCYAFLKLIFHKTN